MCDRSSDHIELLLVEDSGTDARLAMHALGEADAHVEVTAVSDGAAALDMIRARCAGRGRPFDVVLTDLDMPRVGGVELLSAVKSLPELGGLRVIVFTADPSQRARMLALGADAYIVKSSGLRSYRVAAANVTRIAAEPRVVR